MEGSHSGLVRSLGKRMFPKGNREFKSPPFRPSTALRAIAIKMNRNTKIIIVVLSIFIFLDYIFYILCRANICLPWPFL